MKTIIKLLTLLAIVILIGSCKQNSTESIDNKTNGIVRIDINPEKEFNTINSFINNKQVDSISENNYTYWTKDNKIIKLNIFEGDGENLAINEDYYFYDNKVCAYIKKKMDIADGIDYKALVFFNNSEIVKEDYWIREEKTSKSTLENELKMFGSSIKNDILLDEVTKKPKGLLTLADLSKRLGFEYQTGISNTSTNQSNSEVSNFQGQPLKVGEKVIKLQWKKEFTTYLVIDETHSTIGSRYSSQLYNVPEGKKWVLLYLSEDFIFDSGSVVTTVPYLHVNGEQDDNSRVKKYLNKNDVNLSKAKDENLKYYSRSTIKAISTRANNNGLPGNNFVDYNGEMWFLEVNE